MTSSIEALPLTKKMAPEARQRIGIVGTGDFARALAKRLIFSGYDVILGSRVPETRHLSAFDDCLCGVQLTSLDECITRCDVIVAAIHMENFKGTLGPRADLLSGKIVVDVSNRANRYSAVSNAEFLQSIIPDAVVVKAFNSVSAYVLEDQTAVASGRVFVASDDQPARERVLNLARDLGFSPCDMGALRSARSMEAFVLRVFPGWKVPLFFTFGVFNLWALYCVYIYFIEKTAYRWDQVFLKVFNKPLCMTAITVLALTYLPGSVAGVVQLYRGTKYRRFPRWLHAWLVSRRQLGLIALALVLVHALASAMMLSPTYYSSWFQKPAVLVPENVTGGVVVKLQPAWMVWKGELACLLGLAAVLLLVVVGVASLPSVSASLNWAEWRVLQSRLGLLALFLALAHVVAMGAPGWAKGGWEKTFRSITFLSGFTPALTLLLRLGLALPPLGRRLQRIRRGWEPERSCLLPVRCSSSSTSSSASSLTGRGGASGGRKSCIKTGPSAGKLPARFADSALYTPVKTEVDLEGGRGGCSSCRHDNATGGMPTRTCACSVSVV